MELRPISEDELDDFIRAETIGFGDHAHEGHLAYGRLVLDPSRTICMFDGANMVGNSTSYAFDMTVEGHPIASAGLSGITVLPTHRRQGILTRMMTAQLAAARDRGESLMPFWASESHIYPRFGADIAARGEYWKIDRRHTAFRQPLDTSGRVRLLDEKEARQLFPPIQREASLHRNGGIPRNDRFFDADFVDNPAWRDGASAYFFSIFEKSGSAEGYVKYRLNEQKGEVTVMELVGLTEEASEGLWRYCFGIDLMRTIKAENRPSDDPLIWHLLEPARLERTVRHDFWLRLVDVEEALAARTYAVEGKIVAEVKDAFCPWNEGRLSLEGGPDGAAVKPSNEPADIACTANELAAIYLGGVAPSVLVRAGRIEELQGGAIATADAMFRAHQAPCPNVDF